MPELVPVTLTPQETAEFDQLQPAGGQAPINPIRDLSSQEIFDLATNDTSFDIAAEFTRNKDLWGDPAVVQKTADAFHMLRERGFKLSDLPGPGKIVGAVADIAKGFLKQGANYASAALSPVVGAVGELTGQDAGFHEAVAQDAQRKVAENIAGSEASVAGLADMASRGVGKVARGLGISKSLDQYSPEEKVKELFAATGSVEQQQEITKGKGAFLTPVGGEVVKELEQAGTPVRPEEVVALAPGDPLAWWTFGKALGNAGKLVPQPIKEAVAKTGEKVGEVATVAAGKTLQALGETTRVGSKVVGKVAPIVGAIKGGIEAGPLGVLAGTKVGEITKSITKRGVAAGEAISNVGKQVAGEAVSPVAQLTKDVVQAVPSVVGRTAEGLGMDIGLAAVTSETPAETEAGVGLGAALGGLHGAAGAGRRILSGQLIAPRAWGSQVARPSSGQHPTLDAMHTAAYDAATKGQKERLNAVREFVKGAAPDTDVFLASDPQSIERALTGSGVSPEQAKSFANQAGFFTTSLPGKDGKPRRVVVLRDADTAPHEAFHAFQDVIGEQGNVEIDQIIKDAYADRWDAEGQRYADRLTGKPEQNWRDAVVSKSGWGHANALEKVYRDVANRLRAEQGAEPSATDIEAIVRSEWKGGPEAWREILTPEEQIAVADKYLARELAAENFDAVFKNLGGALKEQQGVLPKLARVVSQVVSAFGGEPLADRTSEFGRVPLKAEAVEAVKGAVTSRKPEVSIPPAPTSGKPSRSPVMSSDPVAEAIEIANAAPDQPIAGGTRSPKELLGEVAQAIAARQGIKINYLSAPGEPAAATTSDRAARREVIETFRTMPASARALWEKNFFPDRVLKLKGDKYQVLGWAPEVFASNAHKMAQALAKVDPALSPYQIEGASFSEAGWRELYADVQTFSQNQVAGQTGAGEPLVIPKSVKDRGLFAPPSKSGDAVPLDQRKADFINILFGYKLPETPRIQPGKLPLNIAGQDISIATKPGRIRVPVEPKEKFGELGDKNKQAAEQLNIEGREILEVNPLRNEIQAALGDKYPSLIEAQQRLNLENIKEVQGTPESPEFRGNTLTLTAGFQPRTASGKKLADEGYEYKVEGGVGNRRISLDKDGKEVAFIEAIGDAQDSKKAHIDMVWVNPELRGRGIGEALNREAGAILKEDGFSDVEATVVNPKEAKIIGKVFPDTTFETLKDRQGEAIPAVKSKSKITPEMQFQPLAEKVRSIKEMTDEQWMKDVQNFKGVIGSGPTGWGFDLGSKIKTADELAVLKSTAESMQEITRAAIASKDFDAAGRLATRWQIAHEAYQAATGEKLDGTPAAVDFIRRHYKPDYVPPMPGDAFKQSENKLDIPEGSAKVEGVMSNSKTQAQPKRDKQSEIRSRAVKYKDQVFEGTDLKDAFAKMADAGVSGLVERGFVSESGNFVAEKDADKSLQRQEFTAPIDVAQAQPKKAKDPYKLPSKSAGGFKKAWVLPNGDPVQLGGTWHHEWLSDNPEIAKKYGLAVPKFTGNDAENVREDALKKGFIRVNYGVNNGTLVLEGRASDWRKIKSTMEQMVERNIDEIDNVTVHLFDSGISKVVDSETRRLFVHDNDADKMANLPFSEREPRGAGAQSFKAAAQPEKDDDVDLFGEKRALSNFEIGSMTRDERKRRYPEAIVPKQLDEPIPSEITDSPLFKKAGSEDKAVDAFAKKLMDFSKEYQDSPHYKAGSKWYSEFAPRLRKEFGKDAQLMAELLAATSPQTNVETNFAYALDAMESIKSGRFAKLTKKFEQGLEMLEAGTWKSWTGKQKTSAETPAAFLAQWIDAHNLKPKQTNGKLYGQHSLPVLQVLARRWLSDARGPKTLSFVQNLLGTGHEATIDLWADRTMRRLGYDDSADRWRILPQNVAPVAEADFKFAQKAFRRAAEQLKMNPDDLQGALWFAEKQLWADKGWSRLDLGDFRKEMDKVPLLRQGIKHRLDKTKARDKVKPAQELELSIVEPR